MWQIVTVTGTLAIVLPSSSASSFPAGSACLFFWLSNKFFRLSNTPARVEPLEDLEHSSTGRGANGTIGRKVAWCLWMLALRETASILLLLLSAASSKPCYSPRLYIINIMGNLSEMVQPRNSAT